MTNITIRALVLLSVCSGLVIVAFFIDPIAQDKSYHSFADQLIYFSIPNFWNVVSNLPFVIIGILGFLACKKSVSFTKMNEVDFLNLVYKTFFLGVFFTGFGSAYYHWNPNNTTLLWDRLPMTLSFIAFFIIILGENVSAHLARLLFIPLLLLGIASVIYWQITEQQGVGDLRPYILIQFLPIILIPLILWLYPLKQDRDNTQRFIIYVILAYVIAKLMEHFDHQIFGMLSVMSGHAIKHVIAALGAYYFYLYMKGTQARAVIK